MCAEWTIPFKSERYAISLIGFRVHAGVRKIMSYVMFIQEFMSYMRTLAYFHDAVVMFPYTL